MAIYSVGGRYYFIKQIPRIYGYFLMVQSKQVPLLHFQLSLPSSPINPFFHNSQDFCLQDYVVHLRSFPCICGSSEEVSREIDSAELRQQNLMARASENSEQYFIMLNDMWQRKSSKMSTK